MSSSWQVTADSLVPRRHRWFVAVPVLLVLITLTLREGMMRGSAPAASLTDTTVSDASWPGGHLHTEPGAELSVQDDETVELEQGSMLLATNNFVTVHAGAWDVHVWSGSAYLSAQQSRFTVAAIDVPVVVEGELGTVIVPAGSQWRAPTVALPDAAQDAAAWYAAVSLQPLPAQFLDEQTTLVEQWKLSEGAQDISVPFTASSLARSSISELAAIAVAHASDPSVIAAVRSRPLLHLYAAVHPSVSDTFWAYVPISAASDAETWMGLILLPRTALAAPETSSLTARTWGRTLGDAINASASSGALRTAIVPLLEHDIQQLAHAGYPLRALRFATALRDAVGTGTLLSDESRSALERLSSMTAESLRAAALADILTSNHAVEQSAEHISDVPVPADPALEAQTREVLAAKGAMFTKDSAIHTVGQGMVEVKGVVFGLSSGDRSLHFRFAPATNRAFAIVDGTAQPYGVPLEGYLEWESGR